MNITIEKKKQEIISGSPLIKLKRTYLSLPTVTASSKNSGNSRHTLFQGAVKSTRFLRATVSYPAV